VRQGLADTEQTSPSAFILGYRPWLDGLRAIAITTVVLFHVDRAVGSSPIGGTGIAGVDVFFVLSGFLITTLLLEERQRNGSIALRAFYVRRVRRLMPALALLALGVGVLSLLGLPEVPARATLVNILVVAGYGVNWVVAFSHHEFGVLDHTWSLSIEEQFYLVWPIALIGLVRWNVIGRRLFAVLVTGAAASMVWSAVLREGGEAQRAHAYVGTDARAYGLLLGCAAAVLLHYGLQPAAPWWPPVRAWLAACAAAFLAVFFLMPSLLPQLSNSLAIVALCTAILIVQLSSTTPGWAHKVLSTPPMVWTGRLAYGIYLVNFPVIELLTPARTGLHGYALAALDITVTAGLAIASYFLVERRFLKQRSRASSPTRRRVRVSVPRLTLPVGIRLGAAALVVVVVGLGGYVAARVNEQANPVLSNEQRFARTAADRDVVYDAQALTDYTRALAQHGVTPDETYLYLSKLLPASKSLDRAQSDLNAAINLSAEVAVPVRDAVNAVAAAAGGDASAICALRPAENCLPVPTIPAPSIPVPIPVPGLDRP